MVGVSLSRGYRDASHCLISLNGQYACSHCFSVDGAPTCPPTTSRCPFSALFKPDVSASRWGGSRAVPEASLADIRDKTGEKTVWRKDWDVANESIRAANWGGQPESPALDILSCALSPAFQPNPANNVAEWRCEPVTLLQGKETTWTPGPLTVSELNQLQLQPGEDTKAPTQPGDRESLWPELYNYNTHQTSIQATRPNTWPPLQFNGTLITHFWCTTYS